MDLQSSLNTQLLNRCYLNSIHLLFCISISIDWLFLNQANHLKDITNEFDNSWMTHTRNNQIRKSFLNSNILYNDIYIAKMLKMPKMVIYNVRYVYRTLHLNSSNWTYLFVGFLADFLVHVQDVASADNNFSLVGKHFVTVAIRLHAMWVHSGWTTWNTFGYAWPMREKTKPFSLNIH